MAQPQALDRLARLAVELFKTDLGAVVFHRGGVSRVVASSGLEARFRSLNWDFDRVSYGPSERLVVPDASQHRDSAAVRRFLGLPNLGFLLRQPIVVDEDSSLALLLAGREPRPRPTRRQLQLLADIAAIIRTTADPILPLLAAPEGNVTTTLSLDEAHAAVKNAGWPAALLDSGQRIVAFSTDMARLIGAEERGLIGMRADDLALPMSGAIMQLQEQALRSGLSPPDVEIVAGDAHGGRRAYRLHISPFSPTDDPRRFVYAAAHEVTDSAERERNVSRRIRPAARQGASAPAAFLFDTLVPRRAIRSRKAMQYLTLRSWRGNLRSWQIKALKALKADTPPELPEQIAEEILGDITALFGLGAFRAIVPVPCGHSGEGPCFSLEIARAVGLKSGIPVVPALESRPMRGVSHPKENLRRPPMTLAQALEGPALIVDDVATSGAHLEEAVTLLRPCCGSTLAVAWIGGDSA